MSSAYQALLRPSKETFELLRNVDFSSFHDSSAIDTDTSDPFDPADLMGLENAWDQSVCDDLRGESRSRGIVSGKDDVGSTYDLTRAFATADAFNASENVRGRGLNVPATGTVRSLSVGPLLPTLRVHTSTSQIAHPTLPKETQPLNSRLRVPSPRHSPRTPSRPQPRGSSRATLLLFSPQHSTPRADLDTAISRLQGNVTVSKEPLFVPFSSPESAVEAPQLVLAPKEELAERKAFTHFNFPPPAARVRESAENDARDRRKSSLNATIQLATQHAGTGNVLETKVVKPILLSREQEYVRQLAVQGKSIFFTGSAGTGKSVLLRRIIADLKVKHGSGTVAVTASTGLAAYHIGGITVHSFAGIGLGKGDLASLIKTVRKNRKVMRRWRDTKVLIIDEISMIDGRLFDNLDGIARGVRRQKNAPFGGIQVIVCGDFYQLPPVSKLQINPDGTEMKEQARFTFESEAWSTALSSSIILKEVFRQKGDQTFIGMLNELRHGYVSEAAAAEFRRLSRPLACAEGIVPTELYSTRYEVEASNNMRLLRLSGGTRVYDARDGGALPPTVKNSLLLNFLAPKKLFLKENAQVMCIKNFDDTLVNGSLGRVKGFVDRDTYLCRKIMENDDLSLEEIRKLLAKHRVAYQMSQDSRKDVSVDDVTDDMLERAPPQLDHVFDFLHEDKNFAQLLDQNGRKRAGDVDEVDKAEAACQNKRRKLDFIAKVEQMSTGEKYPLVEFVSPDGLSSRTVLIEPERWEVNDDITDEVLVSRVQLPLILAWAMSIHKSQGQTLPRVRVDLARMFENGHAYVALSRAVSREGLQVVNFRTDRVHKHEVVERFYETLSTTEDLAAGDRPNARPPAHPPAKI